MKSVPCSWEICIMKTVMVLTLSLLLSTPVLFTKLPAQEELPPLAGPALDLPVDVDGDGVPTFGDVFVFNHWLALGGDLETALAKAKTNGQFIDLTQFFSSSASALSPDAAILGLGGGSESPDAPLVASPDGHIDFTRRIPQNPVPNQTSNHARITPDGKVIVFSSLANLDGSGNNTKFQVFRITLDAGGVGDAVTIDLCSKTTGGAKATQHCIHPSVSDDGKMVVFDTIQALDIYNPRSEHFRRRLCPGLPRTFAYHEASQQIGFDRFGW
jgi:hypothetical protein